MAKKNIDFTLDGSVIGEFIVHRLTNDRDCKVIITSKGSSTGLGKTTEAICICRWAERRLNDRMWNADEKGFISIQKYISKYKSCKKQSALIIDELEHGADSRRSMAQDNVDLSHAWAQLRYRNVLTVATLPSVSMVDNRMEELADIWINVVDRGKSIPFFYDINDFTGEIKKVQAKHPQTGQMEIITFPDLAGDEDYKYMTEIKDENVRTGESEQIYDSDEVEEKVKQAKKEKRDEMISKFYNSKYTNISQSNLGKVVGLSQSSITNIVNEQPDEEEDTSGVKGLINN